MVTFEELVEKGVNKKRYSITDIGQKTLIKWIRIPIDMSKLAKAKEFMPDSGKSWRWAKTQGQFYYCLSNIPNRAPQNYRARFGDAQTLLTQYEQAMAPLIRFSAKNIPPTPKRIRPILFIARFLVKNIQTAPTKRIGRAYSPSLKPTTQIGRASCRERV